MPPSEVGISCPSADPAVIVIILIIIILVIVIVIVIITLVIVVVVVIVIVIVIFGHALSCTQRRVQGGLPVACASRLRPSAAGKSAVFRVI